MNRREKLQAARNYALFYGRDMASELAEFDLVIVEPLGQNPQTLRLIRESGTLVCAYLSVVEFNDDFPELQMLKNEDYLAYQDKILVNKKYDNYLADLRSARWRGLLLHKAGQLLLNSGYDGLFLDTIGDVEDPPLAPQLRDSQLIAAVQITALLRTTFPEHLLIQNNGLERLCLFTAGLVDAICWENAPLDKVNSAWTSLIRDRLEGFWENQKIKILILNEGIGSNVDGKGFLHYCASPGYLKLG